MHFNSPFLCSLSEGSLFDNHTIISSITLTKQFVKHIKYQEGINPTEFATILLREQ